jgi:hypothetical protein
MAHTSDSNSVADRHLSASPDIERLNAKAALYLAALGTGLVVALASSRMDQNNRRELESLSQPTAVGDKNWWNRETRPQRKLVLQETPLRETSGQTENFSDTHMLFYGLTDDGTFRLYVPEERANGSEETGGPSWFVKTGPNQFLRLTR